MDTITHGILGAVVSKSISTKNHNAWFTIAGSVAAMAPDLDFLIQSKSNPLLLLEYHRHFTHSLIFIPIGGLIIAFLFWILSKKKVPFRALFVISMIGYATHSFLDSCTSYGTMILWPFSNKRVSWDLISIIDLFFSFTLILGLILSKVYRSRKPIFCSLLIIFTYLGFGLFQRDQGLQIQKKIAADRHQVILQGRVLPTLSNLFLWRSVYKSEGKIYADAIWINPFGKNHWLEGKSLLEFPLSQAIQSLPTDSILRNNLLLYDWFADQYLAIVQQSPTQIGDLRYSLQPEGIEPLWGIEFNLDQPNLPAKKIRFSTDRKEMIKIFLRKLFNN